MNIQCSSQLMGLLNHLFGGKKGIARELIMDEKKRLAVWQKHHDDFPRKKELCKNFNTKNGPETIKDWPKTLGILAEIESQISSELIEVSIEQRLDAEVEADL